MSRFACECCGTGRTSSLVILAAVCVFLLVPSASGGPVGALTAFTNGTVADADQVNANFTAVSVAVNDNDTRITTLQGAGSVVFGGEPFIGANANQFAFSHFTGAESRATITAPRAGVLRNLFIRPDVAPAAGAVVTVAVRINGADSALSVVHTANVDGANSVGNTAMSVPIAQGDRLTVHYTSNATVSGANWATSFEYR